MWDRVRTAGGRPHARRLLHLPRFDPALGALEAVTIALDADIRRGVFVKNTGPVPATFALSMLASVGPTGPLGTVLEVGDAVLASSPTLRAVQDSGEVVFPAPAGFFQVGNDLILLADPSLDNGQSVGDANGTVAGNGDGDEWARSLTFSGADAVSLTSGLQFFVGAGVLDVALGATASSTFTGDGKGVYFPRTFAAATATVIYEFVTPVPAALPLFASALGLLALGRRRG
jgi:hypothetical protein